ncbi:MAG: alpha/beta fold hydrolase [Pseudoxanthomonas sp.]
MGACSALLVHGAGGGAWEWNLWRGVLEAHAFAVHALELQPAAAGLAATTVQDYRNQVRDALQALPHPRVLMGASLGGLLAAMCADQADALVLVNPLPPAPWHRLLPPPDWNADVIPWQCNARLASTREALGDADDASAIFAFRHWRDESGAVLGEAQAGMQAAKPACPTLLIASVRDEYIPPGIFLAMSREWQAERLETVASSHVGPLLGRAAPAIALQAVAWLNRIKPLR